ncbi:hypothetical protein, partial [Salmonella sp. s60131]|uniref:hypothetical protein n=1 Tax=Salmonella sp. s60131 TaxID=3159722 RepID=UPI00397EBE83
ESCFASILFTSVIFGQSLANFQISYRKVEFYKPFFLRMMSVAKKDLQNPGTRYNTYLLAEDRCGGKCGRMTQSGAPVHTT